MIDILVRATVLLVIVAVAALVLRRRSAALRHLLWSLAIAGLMVLPVLTSVVPFRLPVLPAPATVAASALTSDADKAATVSVSARVPESHAVPDETADAASSTLPLQESETESDPAKSR